MCPPYSKPYMPTVEDVCVLVAMCAVLSCREKALAATGDCGGQAAVDWSVGGALGSTCSPHIFLTPSSHPPHTSHSSHVYTLLTPHTFSLVHLTLSSHPPHTSHSPHTLLIHCTSHSSHTLPIPHTLLTPSTPHTVLTPSSSLQVVSARA